MINFISIKKVFLLQKNIVKEKVSGKLTSARDFLKTLLGLLDVKGGGIPFDILQILCYNTRYSLSVSQ
jgi:hypothetical protein